jgi:exocyst complex component 3
MNFTTAPLLSLLPSQAAVQTMKNFQAAQRRHVGEGLGLEMLCAIINNNVRCYDESLEFAEGLEERFADHVKGECGVQRCMR